MNAFASAGLILPVIVAATWPLSFSKLSAELARLAAGQTGACSWRGRMTL